MRRTAIIALVLIAAMAAPAQAHQPRIVGSATVVHVADPEVSKAYYARLPGVPARYLIDSAGPFTLYAQVTVPDLPGAARDFTLTIDGPAGRLASLTTAPDHWKSFFEPFGGDHYLTGPEFRRRVGPGRYTVTVSRPGERGVYVLAIGEAESWGPGETLAALFAIPQIKRDYFHASLLGAWFTRTIPALVILAALIALCGWLVLRGVRRLRGRRRASNREVRPRDS